MRTPFHYLAALGAAWRLGKMEAESRALPRRIKILGWGSNPSTGGPVRVGDKSAAVLLANQRQRGAERVPIDYNHCTVPGSPENIRRRQRGERALIFGSGRVNLIEGDGIWLEDVEWTPEGVKQARAFKDANGAFTWDCGEVDFVRSVALQK